MITPATEWGSAGDLEPRDSVAPLELPCPVVRDSGALRPLQHEELRRFPWQRALRAGARLLARGTGRVPEKSWRHQLWPQRPPQGEGPWQPHAASLHACVLAGFSVCSVHRLVLGDSVGPGLGLSVRAITPPWAAVGTGTVGPVLPLWGRSEHFYQRGSSS